MPKDFSSVSFSIDCRILTVGYLWNELQHMQHVIAIINNKYFTIDKVNYYFFVRLPLLMLLILFCSSSLFECIIR